MSCVIRMASQNCKCPVELLGHHQPGQRMGQRHRTQRQQSARAGRPRASRIGPSAGRTNRENNMLMPFVAASAQPPGKILRGHLPPAAVQQHCQRRRSPLLPLQPLKHRFLGPEPFRPAAGKRRASLQISLDRRVKHVSGSWAYANMCERNLHHEEHTATSGIRAGSTPPADPENGRLLTVSGILLRCSTGFNIYIVGATRSPVLR